MFRLRPLLLQRLSSPDKNVTDFPEVFRACAVTRAMKRAQLVKTGPADMDDDSQKHDVTCVNVPWSIPHSELVSEQEADSSLRSLLDMVRPSGEVKHRVSVLFYPEQSTDEEVGPSR